MTIRKGSEGPASIMCPGLLWTISRGARGCGFFASRFPFDGDLHNDYD